MALSDIRLDKEVPDRNEVGTANLAKAWSNFSNLSPEDQKWLTKWHCPSPESELHLGNLSIYLVPIEDFNHLHRLANPEHWEGSVISEPSKKPKAPDPETARMLEETRLHARAFKAFPNALEVRCPNLKTIIILLR